MKDLMVVLVTSLTLIFITSVTFAQHMHEGHQHGMMQKYESAGEVAEEDSLASKEEPIEVGNKICPVSGKEIKEDEAFKFEYEGKIYNLCCKMCLQDFKKDPQKYIQKIEQMQKEEHQEGVHHEEHHHEH